MIQKQRSILNPVTCYGIGIHSGRPVQLTLKPALPNTGVVFIRTDVGSENNFIKASYYNVSETSLSTTIKNAAKVEVSTVEHLMAAIWGCGIDNIIIELDGPEVPIMDGSSKPFVFMIECAGRRFFEAPRACLKILKEVRVSHRDSEVICEPSDIMKVDLTIDFQSKIIGKQNISFCSEDSFGDMVASARTFGFMHELDYMQSKGLAQGASLDNAIAIDQDVILNHDGLRYKDEFVRHKLLDFLGDFYTSGVSNIAGKFYGYKTGHAINNEFLRTLLSDPSAYELVALSR